jgi:hypothetical protein
LSDFEAQPVRHRAVQTGSLCGPQTWTAGLPPINRPPATGPLHPEAASSPAFTPVHEGFSGRPQRRAGDQRFEALGDGPGDAGHVMT